MTYFKLDAPPIDLGGGGFTKLTASTKTPDAQELFDTQAQDPGGNDALRVAVGIGNLNTATPLDLSQIQHLLDKAEQAGDAIYDLRNEQLNYATKAKTLAQGDPQLTNLDSLYRAAQEEIDDISANATYNGRNILTGETYQSQSYNGSDTIVRSLPSAAPVIANLSLSLTTPANATIAKTALSSAVKGAEAFATATEVARNGTDLTPTQAKEVLQREDAFHNGSSQTITSIEDAEKVASDLSHSIALKFGGSDTLNRKRLIELSTKNLDDDEARNLISIDA